jgi:hypothetical protein
MSTLTPPVGTAPIAATHHRHRTEWAVDLKVRYPDVDPWSRHWHCDTEAEARRVAAQMRTPDAVVRRDVWEQRTPWGQP